MARKPLTFNSLHEFNNEQLVEDAKTIGVSETIRKLPLAEAQTALGKPKIRSVPLQKFCEKLLPHAKFG